jgi:hypothetical protein
MKLKIKQNSPVTITKWKTIGFTVVDRTRAKWVKEGIVEAAAGNTIKVKFIVFRFLFIKIYCRKWYSFADHQYSINVKNCTKEL